MSSALRHICHGIAGFTGMPRPALTAAGGGGAVLEHDISTATNSAANAARAILEVIVCDMAADHRMPRR
jgi:hypothetical protein